MTHRKLIEQMLAVLTSPYKWGGGLEAAKQAAIAAAREYLAAPEGEPVAWVGVGELERLRERAYVVEISRDKDFSDDVALYTHPAPEAKEPQGEPNKCAQCKKAYRHGASSNGCPKCAPGVRVSEDEFQKPLHQLKLMMEAEQRMKERCADVCEERANGENDAQWCADAIKELK